MTKEDINRIIKNTDKRIQKMVAEAYNSYISGASDVGDALLLYVNKQGIFGKNKGLVWNTTLRQFEVTKVITQKRSYKWTK